LKRTRILPVLVALALAALAAGCSSQGGPPRLSLQWTPQDAAARAAPTEAMQTMLLVRNEGSAPVDGVSLRFDQREAGMLPFGVNVGTATYVSSRFDGDVQVWDIGSIEGGQAVAFPMTLWFESAAHTTEPLRVGLVMVATSPDLADDVLSNVFEVTLDVRRASAP
jgi:hypothetical protein